MQSAPALEVIRPEEEEMGLIQGQEPMSRNEWYVAQALEQFKIPYMYQFVVRGNWGLRGLIVVDFLILDPFSQPCEVYGEFWHSGDRHSEDRLREAVIAAYFGREVEVIWGSESDTRSKAREAVSSRFL